MVAGCCHFCAISESLLAGPDHFSRSFIVKIGLFRPPPQPAPVERQGPSLPKRAAGDHVVKRRVPDHGPLTVVDERLGALVRGESRR